MLCRRLSTCWKAAFSDTENEAYEEQIDLRSIEDLCQTFNNINQQFLYVRRMFFVVLAMSFVIILIAAGPFLEGYNLKIFLALSAFSALVIMFVYQVYFSIVWGRYNKLQIAFVRVSGTFNSLRQQDGNGNIEQI